MNIRRALLASACIALSVCTTAMAAPQTPKPADQRPAPASDPKLGADPNKAAEQPTVPLKRPHLDACQLYERAVIARREASRAPDLHMPDLRDPPPDAELEELRAACLDYVGNLNQGL